MGTIADSMACTNNSTSSSLLSYILKYVSTFIIILFCGDISSKRRSALINSFLSNI